MKENHASSNAARKALRAFCGRITREKQMSDSLALSCVLALSGGFQDAYTYFTRDAVFANAQTGNVVLMSASLLRGDWAVAWHYLLPICAFAAGVLAAEHVRSLGRTSRRFHWRQICLLIEAGIMLAVGFMPQRVNVLANVSISFACAMQVQSFRKVGGVSYASTMCIGNLRGGTEALYHYLRYKERRFVREAEYYFGVILAFAVGAALGGNVSLYLKERAIWICAGLLSVGFVMMIPDPPDGGK